MSGQQEVEKFLQEIGLESCVQAVVHNGFYTSMEALKGANYEELVDSGVRPVHAKLILSNLGSKGGGGYGGLSGSGQAGDSSSGDEVNHFLRSVGLENCAPQLAESGFTSLDRLGEASMQDLQNAGLKPVHARLIVSNLDTASTAGIQMTPAAQRLASIDADDTLLGGPKKKPRRRVRLACILIAVLFIGAYIFHGYGSGASATPAIAGAGAAGEGAGAEVSKPHKGKGEHAGIAKGHGKAGGEGKGEGHKAKAAKPMA